MKPQDLTGQIFHHLTVLERYGRTPAGNLVWTCRCACGNDTIVAAGELKKGSTKSCGCLRKEMGHGRVGTPEYKTWSAMLDRCRNPKAKDYPDYGGRGITVCERWHSFENFFADMGERPPGTSIERKDNSLGYSPENCRWASREDQANNKRNNQFVTWDGQTHSVSKWERLLGWPRCTLSGRLRLGWSVERAMTTPASTRRKLNSIATLNDGDLAPVSKF